MEYLKLTFKKKTVKTCSRKTSFDDHSTGFKILYTEAFLITRTATASLHMTLGLIQLLTIVSKLKCAVSEKLSQSSHRTIHDAVPRAPEAVGATW